jgi:DNA-binding NtrC family response regulator
VTDDPLVLLVDDDADLRAALATSLDLAGLSVLAVADAAAALAALDRYAIAVVVSDIRMPGMDGRQLAQRIAAQDADLPVILMTGHGNIEQAVAALRQGAYDFLAKPFASDRLFESAPSPSCWHSAIQHRVPRCNCSTARRCPAISWKARCSVTPRPAATPARRQRAAR